MVEENMNNSQPSISTPQSSAPNSQSVPQQPVSVNPEVAQPVSTDAMNRVSTEEKMVAPVNPQSEAVAINTPKESGVNIVQPTGQKLPPKKIGKEVKKVSKTNFLLGCSGGGLIFFVVFIVLMVLMMSRGGENNPVMAAFNLEPSSIKSFLLMVVSLSFGTLSLLFFVLMIIGVFKLLGAKKGDKIARTKGLKMTLFSFLPFVFLIFIWFFLYSFIGKIELASERVTAEILIVSPKDVRQIEAPAEITFSSQSVVTALRNTGFEIEAIDWDFDGNGEFEVSAQDFEVSYLYNNRGNYNVALRATLKDNDPKIYYLPLLIQTAIFSATPSTGNAPLTVQFDASGLIPRGFKVQSLDWDFDADGKYDIEGPDNLRPRFTFDKIGVFNVHLRVVDQNSTVQNYYRDIEVVPSDTPLLEANIEATPALSGAIPLQIRFDGSKSQSVKGKIVNYEWDFGDGSDLQNGKSVSHVFNQSGFYTVRLKIEEDSGKESETTVQVEAKKVSSEPEAKMTTTPEFDAVANALNGVMPFKVTFDASKSIDEDNDIVDYKWDFDGDGNVDKEGKRLEYVFDTAGTYTVLLTVTDTDSQSDTYTINVVVVEPGTKAVISADPEEGTAPLIVRFDGSSSTSFNGNIVSYQWNFGDGSPETISGATVSHKYIEVRSYTVNLTVTTNKNETATTTQTIYVREIPLRSCFTPSRRNGKAPLSVTFDPKCSTGAIDKFIWNFGDDEKSAGRKPSHTFEHPGAYTVTLEIMDDKSNVDTYTDVIVAEGEVQ